MRALWPLRGACDKSRVEDWARAWTSRFRCSRGPAHLYSCCFACIVRQVFQMWGQLFCGGIGGKGDVIVVVAVQEDESSDVVQMY